jgi:eukaryotic-like serine/threonine-protein kinase
VKPERWQQIKAGLHQALELEGASRQAYIEQITANDAELRQELESLIEAYEGSTESFLDIPAAVMDAGAETPLLLAGSQIGNYRLVCEIGQGGMGQVWLAEQVAPVRRLVALKLIRAGMYDDTVAHRFQAERQSLAIMDHPAIAKVFDAGSTAQGQPYFVMEYVPGLPINEYCDQKRLSIRDRLELFIQACEGVQHAHQKAIVHRDLKPANILIVEVDGKPVPRIIDFGLAKAATPQTADQTLYTHYGQFIGTPGFMSPEQIDPNIRDVDTRADVYSLGVILYVLLTGLQPFETRRQRPPLDQWLRRLREEEPPSLSAKLGEDRENAKTAAAARSTEPKQLASLMRGDLEWITRRALERERERRYGTPSELAADLRRHLDHQPVMARPASTAYQVRKFIRRHRIATMVASMVAVLGIGVSAAGLIALQEKHEAEFQTSQALRAQSRLLTQAAAQRLKDSDVAGAQGILLEVLTNPSFARMREPAAISVFQEIRAAESQRAILVGHTGDVWSAVYSPDGTRVLTASTDKTARIWNAATGTPLGVLSGHTSGLSYAAFSPDGTRIVTCAADDTARIWDAHAGAQLVVLRGHGDSVYSAVYSPDGSHIVTASSDKTARVWDAAGGSSLLVLAGHASTVFSAVYSPDSSRVATASGDKTIRIWDAHTGAVIRVLSGHGDVVFATAYSPDGARLVSGSRDGTARIWDVRTGATVSVLSGHGAVVYSVAYSPDGARIVTASGDKTARLWDARTGALLVTFVGHSDGVFSAAFSPDGARIVTTSTDRTVRIWDATMGNPLLVLSGHDDVVESAHFSPDGARIATASKDRTARIWNSRTGVSLAVLVGHDNVVESVMYSPDGSRVVTGAFGETARIWDANTGAAIAVLSGHRNAVNAAAYSPDGKRIVTGSQDKTARIWDAITGASLVTIRGHDNGIFSASFSPDGGHIVTGSADKTARIWDAATGVSLAVLSGHSGAVFHAAYSPDGTRIVTVSGDNTARIWDTATGKSLMVLSGHLLSLTYAAYSADGTRIVTASRDKTARIWDARNGTPLAVLSGHSGEVYSSDYSPDGMRIVTASADHTARVWDALVPADLGTLIVWSKSAQFDPMSAAERDHLGLPQESRIRKWPGDSSVCDRAAAAMHDPDRLAPGVAQAAINSDVASGACADELARRGSLARLVYENGRALLAKHNFKDARSQFELAISKGYAAARVDLANLLLDGSAGMLDPAHAALLYEQAWQNGVPIAAFELGQLYEYGIRGADGSPAVAFQSDLSKAWLWYSKGADLGEANALAHFAERDEAKAITDNSIQTRDLLLLQAFGFFAAAAERAESEDWPDEAWRGWRYHRATLSRLLANDGMIQQVAKSYSAVLEKWKPRPSTWRQQIVAKLHQ